MNNIPNISGTYYHNYIDLRSFDLVAQELFKVEQDGGKITLTCTLYSFDPKDWLFEDASKEQIETARKSPRTTAKEETLEGEIGSFDDQNQTVDILINDKRIRRLFLQNKI